MIPHDDLVYMGAVMDVKGLMSIRPHQPLISDVTKICVDCTGTRDAHEVMQLFNLHSGIKSHKQPVRSWESGVRMNCVAHCPEPHVHFTTPEIIGQSYRWAARGTRAVIITHGLRPWLRVKQQQVLADELVRIGMIRIMEVLTRPPVINPKTGRLKAGMNSGPGKIQQFLASISDLGWELPPQLQKLEVAS